MSTTLPTTPSQSLESPFTFPTEEKLCLIQTVQLVFRTTWLTASTGSENESQSQDCKHVTQYSALPARGNRVESTVERHRIRFPLLIANLRKLRVGYTDISFRCISDGIIDDAQMRLVDSAQGFRYLVQDHKEDKLQHNNPFLEAFKRGRKTAAKVTRFFSSRDQQGAAGESKHSISSMEISGAALIGGRPRSDDARAIGRITSFQAVEFSFRPKQTSTGHDLIYSSQLMHFSCSSLKAEQQLFRVDGQTTYRSLNIISGVCLYNANIMNSKHNYGSAFRSSLLTFTNPTLYEMEKIASSSSAIADVAAHLIANRASISRNFSSSRLPITVLLDVPSFHYYASIDEYLGSGECTTDEALEWMCAIEKRSRVLATVFQSAILNEVNRRVGPFIPCDGFEIQLSPSANSVAASTLGEELERKKVPKFNDILNTINVCEDQYWRRFWDMVSPEDRPKDFRELGHLFYVYQCVRPALLNTVMSEQHEVDSLTEDPCRHSAKRGCSAQGAENGQQTRLSCLLISVDDSTERPMYDRAQKLLKKIRQHGRVSSHLVEIYLPPRIFINSNETGSNLYFDDPTPDMPLLRLGCQKRDQECVSTSTLDVEHSPFPRNRRLHPVEIVAVLHGVDFARKLSALFTEAGLDGK